MGFPTIPPVTIPERFDELKSTPVRSEPVRVAPFKSIPFKSLPEKSAFDKITFGPTMCPLISLYSFGSVGLPVIPPDFIPSN